MELCLCKCLDRTSTNCSYQTSPAMPKHAAPLLLKTFSRLIKETPLLNPHFFHALKSNDISRKKGGRFCFWKCLYSFSFLLGFTVISPLIGAIFEAAQLRLQRWIFGVWGVFHTITAPAQPPLARGVLLTPCQDETTCAVALLSISSCLISSGTRCRAQNFVEKILSRIMKTPGSKPKSGLSSQTQHLVMDGNKQLVLVLQPGRRYPCEHRAGWRFLGSSGVVKGLKVVTENDQGQSPTM